MHGNQLDFYVQGRVVHVTDMTQYECRGDCSLEMLCALVNHWPELFAGREGTIYYGDMPPPDTMAQRELNFCSTSRSGNPGPWLPFPCFSSVRWPNVGVEDGEGLLEELLVDTREWLSPKLFWIGSDMHPSRRALSELGKLHPDLMDIELMVWNRKNPQSLVSQTRQVSLKDHANYKYLVDCPGLGYSARLRWLLATGRPVFIVDREFVEPWHVEMIPWVHFVPVAADLSDLLEQHARMESEPGLYAKIAKNAREFAAKRLGVEAQLTHVAEKIRETAGPAKTEADYAFVHDATRRLVICRRYERLGWLRKVNMPVVVYDKGMVDYPRLPHMTVIPQPNVGREAQVILRHIVDYWDDLAELTFFSQGRVDDMCPDFLARLEHDYTRPTPLSVIHPGHKWPCVETMEHGHLVCYGHAKDFAGGKVKKWPEEVWSLVFDCPAPEPYLFGFGGLWVVPRAHIKARPLEFWQYWLNEIETGAGASGKMGHANMNAWSWELIWRYVFGDPETYPHKVVWTSEVNVQNMMSGF